MFTCQQLCSFSFAENGFKDSSQWFGQLVFQVILCVDRNVVFQYEDWIFTSFKVLCSSNTFDDDICNTISKCWSRTCISFLHPLCKLHMSLFSIIFFFAQSLCYDEVTHVNLVLKEVC